MNWARRWLSLIFLLIGGSLAAGNLIANPGMEGPGGNRLPPHWDLEVFGAPPALSTDDQIKHSGQSSIRLSSRDVTRAYARSEAIEIAPGEKISASVWVKCQNVPIKPGHVMLVGEFTQEDGSGRSVYKFDIAHDLSGKWEKISGEMFAPRNVTKMRLLIGFSYCQGTIWIDDATVSTPLPLVARMPVLRGRLSPALAEMPVMVMNRQAMRGPATLELILSPLPPKPTGEPVTHPKRKSTTQAHDDDDEEDPAKKPMPSAQAIARAVAASTRPGAELHSVQFVLTGEAKQIVNVPLAAQYRGDRELYLLLYRGTKAIFGAYQPVHIPNALILEPPSPTHWVIEDGSPKFEGLVDLAVTNPSRLGARLQIDVADTKGKILGTWSSRSDLPDGASPYSIAAPGAPIGRYKIVAHFYPARGKEIIAEQHWAVIPRQLASVIINAAGYPVYDGHAIFPLGMFNGSDWKGLQAGGFTVSHAYNATNVVEGEPPDDLAAQKFLDDSEKHGLKALFLIPRGFVFAGDWPAFRRRLRMFKNHPALLAWDEEEGIARGDLSPANFVKMIQIIREEDPYHPIMVGDSRDTISRMGDRSNFFPASEMDMGMWWWYPFPLKNLAAGALQGDEGASAMELVLPAFLVRRNTSKPIWVGVQSYQISKAGRYPTSTEYRAQAYAAICAGAKGLMYYGGGVNRGLQSDPQAAHWKVLQQIVKEISDRADFWMEPESQVPEIEPKGIPISAIIKRHGNRAILVVVNRSIQPAKITMHIPALHGSANVVGEGRTAAPQNGLLEDHFSGLGVHVYEFEFSPR